MKKLLLGAAALTLMFTACKKDEESKPANTWKVGATTYTALAVSNNGSGLTASTTEGGGNSFAVVFSGGALPTTGGSYTIKQNAAGANEVTVIASESSTSGVYQITAGTLTVAVNGGKVTVDVPSTNAKYIGMTTKADVQLSAHLTQQ